MKSFSDQVQTKFQNVEENNDLVKESLSKLINKITKEIEEKKKRGKKRTEYKSDDSGCIIEYIDDEQDMELIKQLELDLKCLETKLQYSNKELLDNFKNESNNKDINNNNDDVDDDKSHGKEFTRTESKKKLEMNDILSFIRNNKHKIILIDPEAELK